MYGYIYLTTNLVNGKKYIGQHKSSTFSTKYMGTGKLIKQAINKNGKENFKVEMLEACNSPEELNEAEKRIIKQYNAVYSDEYYNIAYGGVDNMGHPLSDEEKIQRGKTSKEVWTRPEYRKKMSNILHELQKDGKSWVCGTHHTEEYKKFMSERMSGKNHPMYGKHHTDEARKKMSYSAKNRPHPPTTLNNIWINNGIITKSIKAEDFSEYEKLGYTKGRLKGSIWINNGIISKCVSKDKLDEYISSGFVVGRLPY